MVVGVCRLTLSLPENASLKGKRSVLRRIISRVRQRFNVAIAEIEEMDSWQTAVIAFAVVSNDVRVANSVADRVVDFVEELYLADLVDHQFEVLHC